MKVLVIGAGAAGLTAAIFAAKNNCDVVILEKTNLSGKKILVSGGTRCNILPELVSFNDYFTSSNKNLMKNILKSWSLDECIKWFKNDIGLKLALEKESNKWFPESNSAKEVRDLLLKKAESLGVRVFYENSVNEVFYENNMWICKTETGSNFTANKLIISTGGLSIPKMGTDGAGHKFLKKIGHSINHTYPALTPLKGKHPGKELIPGISLDIDMHVKIGSKKIKAERSGFLFTHKGFSGPTILDISHYAILALEKNTEKPEIYINWAGINEEAWRNILQPVNSPVINKIKEFLPSRLAVALCQDLKIEEKKLSELKKEEKNALIEILTRYKLNYTGHEGYEKAEVTGGGIPLEEIDTVTLESKLFKNLFLCGEILDVFGRIGGFNFYWAWVTGRLAGNNVAMKG